jgi:hypothetical protein
MAEHCCAECRLCWWSLMPSVTLKLLMLSAIMLNVVMLSVVAPHNKFECLTTEHFFRLIVCLLVRIRAYCYSGALSCLAHKQWNVKKRISVGKTL